MKLRIMSVCAAMTTLAGAASADPVTFTFTGEVTSNTFTSGSLAGVSVGEAATYKYTFDSSFVGNQNNTGTTERYNFGTSPANSPITSATTTVGGVSATSTSGSIMQMNGLSGNNDAYQVSLWNTGLAPQVILSLVDTNGTVFSSASIDSLETSLDLSAFTHAYAIINDPGVARMDLVWTSLQIDNPVIPLPAGAAMAFVGLGMVGVRRRRNASPNEV